MRIPLLLAGLVVVVAGIRYFTSNSSRPLGGSLLKSFPVTLGKIVSTSLPADNDRTPQDRSSILLEAIRKALNPSHLYI